MKSLLFFCVAAWFIAAVSGVAYLTELKYIPGEENGSYPSIFPRESRLEWDSARPTLIFFAHPKCPCTRASLRELARLMNDIDGRVNAYVVFIKPLGESDEWTQTSLRDAAAAIPNVQVVIDEENRETNIFNARTSSLILLYDELGNLRFNGGITAARGHEGENVGRGAIFDIVTSGANQNGESLVFGCPLREKDCEGDWSTMQND